MENTTVTSNLLFPVTTLYTTSLALLFYSTVSLFQFLCLPLIVFPAHRSLYPAVSRNWSWQWNLRRTVPNYPQLTPGIALSVAQTVFGYTVLIMLEYLLVQCLSASYILLTVTLSFCNAKTYLLLTLQSCTRIVYQYSLLICIATTLRSNFFFSHDTLRT